jgi:hypothetical protein
MQYFFILSHLGCRLDVWNDILKTNPFLISHFVYNKYNIYYNRDIKFKSKYEKRRISRHFDILVHNWQTGLKDTLDLSKIIYLYNEEPDALEKIKTSGIIDRNCAKSYLDRRKDFIIQTVKRNNNVLFIEDNFEKLNQSLNKIADFAQVPPDFKLPKKYTI